nr:GNAT family N-acetyltransferase [uncultured Allomuricauda sp.]
MFKDFELIRLEPETEVKPFNCGDSEIDGFLFDDAKTSLIDKTSVTYLLQNSDVTVAYWNYLNDKIQYAQLNNEKKWLERVAGSFTKNTPLRSYPAVKIGRLGVHKDFKRKGIGTAILDYTKNLFVTNNRTGCAFITVDAFQKSTMLYEKNGFLYLSSQDLKSKTRLMYYDLNSIS